MIVEGGDEEFPGLMATEAMETVMRGRGMEFPLDSFKIAG
jgi:hypothetical protein